MTTTATPIIIGIDIASFQRSSLSLPVMKVFDADQRGGVGNQAL
jgi:hypothetical protein